MKPTAKELMWFRIANSGHPPGFYPFKDRFLKRFATFDGYDQQIITKECWTCEGSGLYRADETCRSCGGDGVYRTDKHWLERWILCGSIYHRPLNYSEAWEVAKTNKPVDIIEGRIQHAPVTDGAARRAFYRLLLRFEPVNFYHQVCADIHARALHHRAVWAWRLMRLRDKLDLFPAVKEAHDDIPF